MDTAKLGPIRAIIFDLDGTLIDSKQDLIRSVNAMLQELQRTELEPETISGYIGHGAPQLIGRALGEAASEDERKHGLEFFLRYYEEHKMDTTYAYPGVAQTLAELAHLPMAVLTNKPVRISVRILEELGLKKHFRAIYGGNSFEKKKPDPLGTKTILREFAIAPRETLFVGDSEVDVQTARNSGTLAATVNYGFGTHDRLAHPADVYLEQFKDLATLLDGRR